MVVQLPPDRDQEPARAAVEAGVIDDARARHRRERRVAAIIAAIALSAGLIFALGGGGGGAGAGGHAAGRGRPIGPGQPSSRPVAVVAHIAHVSQFGLLAPGVGWAINDGDFYLTRDGGFRWEVLSHRNFATGAGGAVAGLRLAGDLTAELGPSSSPSPKVLALGYISRWHVDATCRQPISGAVGVSVLSSDAGRTWSAHVLPGCRSASSLSFVSARTGYAVQSLSTHDSRVYRTLDGGAHWRMVSRFPAPMTVSFGTRSDGLAWVTPNTRTGAAVLYSTTDGGHSWRRSRICGPTADPTYTVYCGVPVSFGARAVVLAMAQDLTRHRGDRGYVYATADAGRRWSRHAVPPLASPEMPAFSAPNPDDLFLYSLNGVLYRSTDGGRSWRSSQAPQFRQLYQMQFVNAAYGWILAAGHFDVTTDGGRSWRPVGTH